MRVSYVTMSFPEPVETFAISDIKALLGQGAVLSVHSLKRKHPAADDLIRQRGLSSVRIGHNGVERSLSGALRSLRRPRLLGNAIGLAFACLRRPGQFIRTLAVLPRALDVYFEIERESPDVVHAFWGHYPALVIRLVQLGQPERATSLFLGAYDLEWDYPLSRPAALAADAVWTHARTNLPQLRAMGIPAEKLHLAHRGLDLSSLPPARVPVPDRLVSAGRLIPPKGMDSVLRVFSEVLALRPGATLVILGDGPERPALEALGHRLGVADRVSFRGHVSHAQVLEEFRAASVMLFLSRKTSERLPNAVKEAMACGCYCVASATPGMDELIPNGDCGLVVTTADPRAIARHIGHVLGRPDLLSETARNSAAHINRNFDNRVVMGSYLDEWRAVVRRRAARGSRSAVAIGGTRTT